MSSRHFHICLDLRFSNKCLKESCISTNCWNNTSDCWNLNTQGLKLPEGAQKSCHFLGLHFLSSFTDDRLSHGMLKITSSFHLLRHILSFAQVSFTYCIITKLSVFQHTALCGYSVTVAIQKANINIYSKYNSNTCMTIYCITIHIKLFNPKWSETILNICIRIYKH